MGKKTIWDLDYQAIIEFAEQDHIKAVQEGNKYAVLRDEHERKLLKDKEAEKYWAAKMAENNGGHANE